MPKLAWLAPLSRQLVARTPKRRYRKQRLSDSALGATIEILEQRVVPAAPPAPIFSQDFADGATILRTRFDAPPERTPGPPPAGGGSLRPPLELNSNGLEFNLIPASGMSQTAIDGFQAAANLWSAILRDDIKVNINIDFKQL